MLCPSVALEDSDTEEQASEEGSKTSHGSATPMGTAEVNGFTEAGLDPLEYDELDEANSERGVNDYQRGKRLMLLSKALMSTNVSQHSPEERNCCCCGVLWCVTWLLPCAVLP
jgi:hypothetical protein